MEYRLYFFVPYNISDIQKGIQAGHAALEYANFLGSNYEYLQFIKNDKTWIILNGGTTNDETGDLNNIMSLLHENDINYTFFREPDLNNALTAICFLADERVWNKEKYPDYEECPVEEFRESEYKKWVKFVGGDKNVFLRELLKDKHLA